MEQLKDIAAWIMLTSVVAILVIAVFLGFKAIFNHLVDFSTYRKRERDSQEEIAAYKAKVKELQMKSQSTEVVNS